MNLQIYEIKSKFVTSHVNSKSMLTPKLGDIPVIRGPRKMSLAFLGRGNTNHQAKF